MEKEEFAKFLSLNISLTLDEHIICICSKVKILFNRRIEGDIYCRTVDSRIKFGRDLGLTAKVL